MKKLISILAVFVFVINSSAQLGVPNNYKDTATVSDSAKAIWQFGPPWVPANIRSQKFGNLKSEIAASIAPSSKSFIHDSLVNLLARNNTWTGVNKFTDTMFLGNIAPTLTKGYLTIAHNIHNASINFDEIRHLSSVNPIMDGTLFCAFDISYAYNGAFNAGHLAGYQSRIIDSSTANVGSIWDFLSWPNLAGGSGTVGERFGVRVLDPLGTKTLTNNYGVFVDNMTRGANNWAIYANGTTPSYFGGPIEGSYVDLSGVLTIDPGSPATTAVFGATRKWYVHEQLPFNFITNAPNGGGYGIATDASHLYLIANSATRAETIDSSGNVDFAADVSISNLGTAGVEHVCIDHSTHKLVICP